MIDWISVTLALYLAGHLVCFGVSRLIAGRYENYTLARTALAFFLSWISLPIITAVAGVSPSNFLGSRNFYLASFLASALFLFMLSNKSETNKASTTKRRKEKDPAKIATMNKIAEEGYTAFTNGIPKTSNPYRSPNIEEENLDYVDYWDRGYVLAENRKKQQ